MALGCALCAILTFVTALGLESTGSCVPDSDSDAALHLLQHRATSLVGQHGERDSVAQRLDTLTEWPSNRLRLCQRKADEVTYGMKITALKQSNLGNRGPDTGAQEMRFAVEVTTPNQPVKSLDFVVVNTSFYLPFNTVRNNLYPGDKEYFMINVWEGGNTEISFKGTFVESDTNNEVKMKDIYVTYYDIDQQTQTRVERLFVKDFFKYSVSQTSALIVQQDGEWTVIRPPVHQVGGVAWDPSNLSPAALDQSILLHYRETSSFEFKTSVAGEVIASGRNYMFAIHSALTECPNGFVCDIFGDPHISSFDNAKPVLLDDEDSDAPLMSTFDNMALVRDDFHDGDVWLVKSKHVLIQGRYGKTKGSDKSFLKAVAIGGPFLHNNTLVLASVARACLWNQQDILTSLGSTHVVQFEDGGLVKASYQSGVRHIHDANQTTDGVEVELPMGVKLFLNRFKTWLGLRIHLHSPIEGGQDGECGNINGNPDDDSQLMVEKRMNTQVHENETLFVGRYFKHKPQDRTTTGFEDAAANSKEAFVAKHEGADVKEEDEAEMQAVEDVSSDSLSDGELEIEDVLAAEDEAENLPQPDDEMTERTNEQHQSTNAVSAGATVSLANVPKVASDRPVMQTKDAEDSYADYYSNSETSRTSLANVPKVASALPVMQTKDAEDSYADYYSNSETSRTSLANVPKVASDPLVMQTKDAEDSYADYYSNSETSRTSLANVPKVASDQLVMQTKDAEDSYADYYSNSETSRVEEDSMEHNSVDEASDAYSYY